MNDVRIEQIVKAKQPKYALALKILMIFLCLLSLTVARFSPAIAVVLTACFVVFTVLLFRYYDAEFEYTFVEHELMVDRIMAKSSRRKGETFDLNKLEIMAPVGSDKTAYRENQRYKLFDYSSGTAEDVYVMFVPSNAEMVKVIFEPNEAMQQAIKNIAPAKVTLKK